MGKWQEHQRRHKALVSGKRSLLLADQELLGAQLQRCVVQVCGAGHRRNVARSLAACVQPPAPMPERLCFACCLIIRCLLRALVPQAQEQSSKLQHAQRASSTLRQTLAELEQQRAKLEGKARRAASAHKAITQQVII